MAIGKRIKYYREKLGWTLEEMSSRCGVEIGTISAIENRDSDRSKYFGNIAKSFGLTIEQLSDVGTDWLSNISDSQKISQESAKYTPSPEPSRRMISDSTPDEVIIPQYNAVGSMGNGLILDGMAGVIKSWHVDHEWLRLNVRRHTGVKNLCIVTGFGPSMRPMFNPGDPLLVDRGVTEINSDAVYFFRVGNHGYIKTIQRIPTVDGKVIYRAKSKNPDFDPFDIVEGMDFEVFGKVLTVWKSEQF